jgi:hypothetical protein
VYLLPAFYDFRDYLSIVTYRLTLRYFESRLAKGGVWDLNE